MKIVIIGLPNMANDEEIANACKTFSEELGISLKVTVLNQSDILPDNSEAKPETAFMKAVNSTLNAIPYGIETTEFRAEFYKRVLDGTIEKPILNVLSFGPKSRRDLNFLNSQNAGNLPTFAKVALSMIS